MKNNLTEFDKFELTIIAPSMVALINKATGTGYLKSYETRVAVIQDGTIKPIEWSANVNGKTISQSNTTSRHIKKASEILGMKIVK